MYRFRDRRQAGEALAVLLHRWASENPIVLGLARGGLPVAFEVAKALGAPLEVLVVRKLGAPSQPELGVGAVAEEGVAVVDDDTCQALGLGLAEVDGVARRERAEIVRRVQRYRGGRALPPLADRNVILVDDGIAMGVTARAAIRAVSAHRPKRIIFAVPVASMAASELLGGEACELVSVVTAARLMAVGEWYEDFDQVDDSEVSRILAAAQGAAALVPHPQDRQ